MIPLLEQVQQNETEAKGLHQKTPPQMFPMEKVKKKIQNVSAISTSKNAEQSNNKAKKKRKNIIEHIDSADSGCDVSSDDTQEPNDQVEDLQSYDDQLLDTLSSNEVSTPSDYQKRRKEQRTKANVEQINNNWKEEKTIENN